MDVAWAALALNAANLLGALFYLGSKIDSINTRIDALGARLDSRIDALGARLDSRINALGGQMQAHIERHPS